MILPEDRGNYHFIKFNVVPNLNAHITHIHNCVEYAKKNTSPLAEMYLRTAYNGLVAWLNDFDYWNFQDEWLRVKKYKNRFLIKKAIYYALGLKFTSFLKSKGIFPLRNTILTRDNYPVGGDKWSIGASVVYYHRLLSNVFTTNQMPIYGVATFLDEYTISTSFLSSTKENKLGQWYWVRRRPQEIRSVFTENSFLVSFSSVYEMIYEYLLACAMVEGQICESYDLFMVYKEMYRDAPIVADTSLGSSAHLALYRITNTPTEYSQQEIVAINSKESVRKISDYTAPFIPFDSLGESYKPSVSTPHIGKFLLDIELKKQNARKK